MQSRRCAVRRTAGRGATLTDLRYATRSAARSPAFAVTAILTLALGIGTAASMFVLIDAYFLRNPSGVVDWGRLR